MLEIKVCESREALAKAASELFLDRFLHKGSLSVAVSGGSTPGPAYRLIAQQPVDWSKVSVWWVDERFVPPSDGASNEKLVRETWLNYVAIPPEQVHPMYRPGSPMEAASDYGSAWLKAFESGGVDVAFMGIGTDGHTASLFPGDQEALNSEHLVLPTRSPVGEAQRITLSRKALSRCGELVFLITGKEKAPYVRAIRDGVGDWPACQVARAAKMVTLLVDQDAAE